MFHARPPDYVPWLVLQNGQSCELRMYLVAGIIPWLVWFVPTLRDPFIRCDTVLSSDVKKAKTLRPWAGNNIAKPCSPDERNFTFLAAGTAIDPDGRQRIMRLVQKHDGSLHVDGQRRYNLTEVTLGEWAVPHLLTAIDGALRRSEDSV